MTASMIEYGSIETDTIGAIAVVLSVAGCVPARITALQYRLEWTLPASAGIAVAVS